MEGLIDELVYQNYRTNRRRSPGMTPNQLAQVFGPHTLTMEKRYQQELDGDACSFIAQERYEAGVVEEARAIVEGRSTSNITKEHLRVVLAWLDGCTINEAQDGSVPF